MLTATIIFCIFATVAYFIWKRQKLASLLPPGPPAWPIIGNIYQIDPVDPRKTLVEWHKKYGPIFTVWMGFVPNVFVTGYDLMQELFVKRGDEFADRPESFIFELFTSGKYGIVNISGDIWKDQRRFSLHTLRNFGFGRKIMEEKIVTEVDVLEDHINKEIGNKNYADVAMRGHLELCINNIIASIVVGQTYEADDLRFIHVRDGLAKLIEHFQTTTLIESFPWLRHIPLFGHFGYDGLKSSTDEFFNVIVEQLAENKKQFNPNEEPTNFADAYWLEMHRRQEKGESLGYFGEWQLTAVIGDIWSAGVETTVTTLSWAVLLMMHYPEVQKKVHQEIDNIVGKNRAPDMNDKANLPYINAVVNEIQRWSNVVFFNVPHTPNKDAQVMSYVIPKGVTIAPQIAAVHYDDTIYDQPLTFNPDRFLSDKTGTSAKSEHLIPFSLGKRVCMGESLARMELYLIFAAMLQKYNFDFIEGQEKPTLVPQIGFTAFPKRFKTRISLR